MVPLPPPVPGAARCRAQPPRTELVSRLHARAAAWFEANNPPEEAVDHAQAAGNADRAARLVEDLAQPAYASGRAETARRWLGWFEDRGVIERYPVIAVLGAEVAVRSVSRRRRSAWPRGTPRGRSPAAVAVHHLGYREIGERPHRSRHTVKSQVRSIYRKLGVSSRDEAMTRLQELGMLGS